MPIYKQCSVCKKEKQIFLDKATKKVYCGVCDNEMPSNHFLVMQLQVLKDYREQKATGGKGIPVNCPKCKVLIKAVIKSKVAYCPMCNSDLKLSKVFIQTLEKSSKDEPL